MALLGELDLNANPALQALQKVNHKVDTVLNSFTKFGKFAAGGFIATEAITKVLEGFHGVLELGSQLHALHVSTAESVHDLFIFQKALVRAGGSAEIAQNFIFKLQNAIAGVNEDGKSTSEALRLLGVTASELRQMPLLDQISRLQAGLAGIADQSTKVAAIKQLFGFRFAAQAMPLLANPEALEQAKVKSEAMANLMERNAHAFHDLELAIKGVKGNLTEFMAGSLEVLAPNAMSLASALGSIDFIGFGRAAGQFINVLLVLARVLIQLGPLINSVSKALEKMNSTTLAGAGIGAAVGTFAAGPVGTIVGGAMGGFIGSLFGGEAKKEQHGFAEQFRGLNEPEKDERPMVTALQKIGLGGFGSGADPMLSESRRQTSLLEQIRDRLGPDRGPSTLLDHPVPV